MENLKEEFIKFCTENSFFTESPGAISEWWLRAFSAKLEEAKKNTPDNKEMIKLEKHLDAEFFSKEHAFINGRLSVIEELER